ncbi:MAG: peptidylprolyl isomerase, partial [Phycisphaerales bacterium]|nr:peptidylprolyl isomerase [Phycisphaerales bacterium]
MLVLPILLVGATVLGLATPAPAQSETEAADAFAPLEKDFFNLFKSFQNQYGLREGDAKYVHTMIDRMNAYAKSNPKDPRPIASIVAMADWLNDRELRNDTIRRLAPLVPDNTNLVIEYTQRLTGASEYGTVLDFFKDAGRAALSKSLDAAMIKAECEYCENRFDDALATLAAARNDIPNLTDADLKRIDDRVAAYTTKAEQWSTEQAIRDAEKQADDLPRAEIETSKGVILVELFENEAPNTVANFIDLAESGFYDNIIFHRVLGDFMSQGGNPANREGVEDPMSVELPKLIPDEHPGDDNRRHFAGSLAMANTGAPDSGRSQFYITHRPTEWLDGLHTVFGRVLDGEDIARSLKQGVDKIITVRIVRKRDHPYEVRYFDPATAAAPTPSD